MSPGSKEAIAAGCTCPVEDNNHGEGMWHEKRASHLFWIAYSCTIHSPEAEKMAKLKVINDE